MINALFDLHKKYDKLEKENEKLRKDWTILNQLCFKMCEKELLYYIPKVIDDERKTI